VVAQRIHTLTATDVTKIFPHPSLEGTNISLFAGVFFKMDSRKCNYLIGSSGSGKTTLLNIILGLQTIDAGQIMFDKIDVHKMNGKEKQAFMKKVAIINQTPQRNVDLFLSVCQNLKMSMILHSSLPREERDKKIKEIANRFEISEHIETPTRKLSGGEIQRLSLACAVVFEPEILLCDEPTAQLDKQSRELVRKQIISLPIDFSTFVLITTHDKLEVKNQNGFLIKNRRILRWK